jgi:hypothetical protein
MTDISKHTHDSGNSAVEQNDGRRRFLGKGIKAAPFVITLASQPALGTTCFTPSRSLSKNTSISQQGKDGVCTGAESPGNYKAQQDPNSNAYHWPTSPKPTDPLHPTFYMGNSEGVTKFTKTVNHQEVSKTFGEALAVTASGQVHFHLIAAYLNVKGGNGAVISDKAITASGVLAIWEEFAKKGYYEPVAGVKWYATEIVDYLKSNGIVT